jgi:methylthioribose-1-phosphate isomerase
VKIGERQYRIIWLAEDGWRVNVIDQTKLPFSLEVQCLSSYREAARAIHDMIVRGAPLIGATAAYGVALAMREDASDSNLAAARDRLHSTRPTAVNLTWALDQMHGLLAPLSPNERMEAAYIKAADICDSDVDICKAIGMHGLAVIRNLWEASGKPPSFNILTHCNAGWLACVDWGTALAPIYMAHDEGIPVHVWVDETRPRNQGAALTAYELGAHGVNHTIIADNTGGHLMQCGRVDMVIVGSDRTTYTGDVCNKIGTYLKALAAFEARIPFYVALPSTTIDWETKDGGQIPIEERDAEEITHIHGKSDDGRIERVKITPDGSLALNIAFDVTPAKYVTGLITESGACEASERGIGALFPRADKGAPS